MKPLYADHHIDGLLQCTRTKLISDTIDLPSPKSPRFHCEGPVQTSLSEHMSSDSESDNEASRKRARSPSVDSDQEYEDVPHENVLVRPSEFLRAACPACFGGNDW